MSNRQKRNRAPGPKGDMALQAGVVIFVVLAALLVGFLIAALMYQ